MAYSEPPSTQSPFACVGVSRDTDQRQSFLPFALTHNFCYRNSVVASLKCYQKLEVMAGGTGPENLCPVLIILLLRACVAGK